VTNARAAAGVLPLFFYFFSGACSSASLDAAGGYPGLGTGGGGSLACGSTADCPSGLICNNGTCVSPADNEPPETKQAVAGPPPAATPHYIFTLDAADGLIVRVSFSDLSIEAIPIGGAPSVVEAQPNVDRAFVLNPGRSMLQVLDATNGGPTSLENVPFDRQQDVLNLSPDGAWAVASTDPDTEPDEGAEGIATVVQLQPPGGGMPVTYDRAVGYRVSNVFFRVVDGAATSAVVVAKDSVSQIALAASGPPPLPPRLSLPESAVADFGDRGVVATSDGHFILIQSFTDPSITVVDVDGWAISQLSLSDIPTDLEVEPSGAVAVAVLRATAKVQLIDLPGDLADVDGGLPTPLDLGGFNAGQIALSPVDDPVTGPFGILFTNATDTNEIARLDLNSGLVTPYPDALLKLVQAVGISPNGKTAIIVHRPQANPATTDPYELAVAEDTGFSMFDLGTAVAQLTRTNGVPISAFAFVPQGDAAAVALRDDTNLIYGVDSLDLTQLIAQSFTLPSAPEWLGGFPVQTGVSSPRRVFVTQIFAGGRISFLNLDAETLETVTGFELNSQIDQ